MITEQESQETIQHLQRLVQINTTNPPGNEVEACRYLANLFDREEIPYKILEAAPNRGNIVAHLRGDGSKKPLLLASHLDVVPAERDKWDVDPFSGVVKDGFIWGRGTVDMKQMTAMELAVFLKAHREKVPLKRDLIFAAVADEEVGCELGSKWLVENHPDLIRAEYGLNEVGGFSLTVNDTVFYPIGVGIKGVCWLNIKAQGKPGHGAMPHNDQALPRLTHAAHKLSSRGLPFHKSELVTEFIHTLAKYQRFPINIILKSITKPILSGFILNKIFPDKMQARNFLNLLHNLATPTVMHAGTATNVIPSWATLSVDGRILPGQTVDSFLAEVKRLLGPGFEYEITSQSEPIETDYHNDFFDTLKTSLIKHDPGAVPMPYLIPAFTDAKFYNKLGIKCYGFAPMKLPKEMDFKSLFHAHNERIPVEAIKFGVQVLWDVIEKTCCA